MVGNLFITDFFIFICCARETPPRFPCHSIPLRKKCYFWIQFEVVKVVNGRSLLLSAAKYVENRKKKNKNELKPNGRKKHKSNKKEILPGSDSIWFLFCFVLFHCERSEFDRIVGRMANLRRKRAKMGLPLGWEIWQSSKQKKWEDMFHQTMILGDRKLEKVGKNG